MCVLLFEVLNANSAANISGALNVHLLFFYRNVLIFENTGLVAGRGLLVGGHDCKLLCTSRGASATLCLHNHTIKGPLSLDRDGRNSKVAQW